MAGFLDGLVKGLASIAPQDDPEVKMFNAQNELKGIAEKGDAVYTQLGKKVYAEGGKETYPDTGVQLEALAAQRAEIQNKITQLEEEKAAREKAAAEEGRTCPNCGTVNGEGCKFCCNCGTKLPEHFEQPKKRFCTSCGAEIADGMRFCSACGAKQE